MPLQDELLLRLRHAAGPGLADGVPALPGGALPPLRRRAAGVKSLERRHTLGIVLLMAPEAACIGALRILLIRVDMRVQSGVKEEQHTSTHASPQLRQAHTHDDTHHLTSRA